MYCCPRCNYNTNRKNNLNIHFNKKKGCEQINNVELDDEVKRLALETKITLENSTTNEINGSHNSISSTTTHDHAHNTTHEHSHNTTHENSHNTNTSTINIFHLASSLPILTKYEELFDHLCKDMPKKATIDDKKKHLFGRAIHVLDNIKWNECLDNIPGEFNIKTLTSMLKYLLDVPNKNRNNPADIVFNTMVLHDGKKKKNYVYGLSGILSKKKPGWLNNNEISILSYLSPMIRAFERNILKIMYAQWNNRENNVFFTDRLRKLYKIMNCLEFETTLSHLDAAAFVNEILDIDINDDNYDNILEHVDETKIINSCKVVHENAKEEIRVDDDETMSKIDDLYDMIQDKSELSTEDINETFFDQCHNNPDFLDKVNRKTKEKRNREREREFIPDVFDLEELNK